MAFQATLHLDLQNTGKSNYLEVNDQDQLDHLYFNFMLGLKKRYCYALTFSFQLEFFFYVRDEFQRSAFLELFKVYHKICCFQVFKYFKFKPSWLQIQIQAQAFYILQLNNNELLAVFPPILPTCSFQPLLQKPNLNPFNLNNSQFLNCCSSLMLNKRKSQVEKMHQLAC